MVSLVLPIADISTEQHSKPTDDPQQSRIPLVDDDILVRRTIQSQLELAGYKVVSAADGAAAVAAFEVDGADLLVTDFAMPGIDGLTLISRLQERARNLPAILITGYARDNINFDENGSYRLLYKPFTSAKMQALVATCLGTSLHV